MNNSSPKRKAVALLSGGLDSMLATKLILDQGIEVVGLNFYTGFCHSGHTSAIRNNSKKKPKRNDALWSAEQLGIKLHIVDIVEEYKNILTKPQYGYGQHLNPCLDCKVFMVKKAFEWMEENDFDFIITGEVIGQRPKSQRKETMPIVAKRSGAEDKLLRPLCAKHLPETLPEREGWVSREALLGLHGRGRKGQIELAQKYAFADYAQPSGGCCVLTDAAYTRKLKDLWQSAGQRDYSLDDIILLKVGRHLRPAKHFKVILGREEGENNFLEGYRKQFPHIRIKSHKGPLVLIDGELHTESDKQLALQIAARYSDGKNETEVACEFYDKGCEPQALNVAPLAQSEIKQEWYV